MKPSRSLLIGALIALASCSPSESSTVREGDMADPSAGAPLVPMLRVRVSGDTVALDLAVANPDAAAVQVTFSSSQRYDFVVLDESGTEVWRWSADRMFSQALSEEEVPAGAVLEYHEVWPEAVAGTFRVVASFESTNHPLELTAEFVVPEG